jgi:hypothetical protein
MTLSPHSIRTACGHRHAGPSSEGDIAIAVPKLKTIYINGLNENAPVERPGQICRAGNYCRA